MAAVSVRIIHKWRKLRMVDDGGTLVTVPLLPFESGAVVVVAATGMLAAQCSLVRGGEAQGRSIQLDIAGLRAR